MTPPCRATLRPMAKPDTTSCGVCGTANAAHSTRCTSCGAMLQESAAWGSSGGAAAGPYQQRGFEWKWVLATFGLDLILGTIALVALPKVIAVYDPQGFWGLVILAVLWFLGAAIIGLLSPGRTYLEPPVGGLLAALPMLVYLASIADVFALPSMAHVAGGLFAVVTTLLGAFVGERFQTRPAT